MDDEDDKNNNAIIERDSNTVKVKVNINVTNLNAKKSVYD